MAKKLIIAGCIYLLAGCTAIDAFLMRYDANEYQQINDIRTTAYFAKSTCDDTVVSKTQAEVIVGKTITFKNYVEYLPHNDKVINASIELDNMAQGLRTQYNKGKVSPAFCKIKFQNIEKSAEIMQKTIGDKPRP